MRPSISCFLQDLANSALNMMKWRKMVTLRLVSWQGLQKAPARQRDYTKHTFERIWSRDSILEPVPVSKPVPAAESNVSPLVYSDPRLRSAEIKWNTSISDHLWRWSRYDINIIISIISSHKSSSYKRYHLLGKPTLVSWVGGGGGGCPQVGQHGLHGQRLLDRRCGA